MLDFQEKATVDRGQLAPKFSDLVTTSNIVVAKKFRPFRPYKFTQFKR